MHWKGRAVQKTMGVVVFLCLFQVVLLKIGLFHHENWPVDGWIWLALGILGFFLDRCFFFWEKAGSRRGDLMVIRFRGYRSFKKCHSLTRWWQLRCFLNFHRRKFGEKMKPFWRQAYFWKGWGWFNHQLVLFGKPGRNVHFLFFGKGFSKRGLMFCGAVNWGSFVFLEETYSPLRVYFWGVVASSHPQKKDVIFSWCQFFFWNMWNSS